MIFLVYVFTCFLFTGQLFPAAASSKRPTMYLVMPKKDEIYKALEHCDLAILWAEGFSERLANRSIELSKIGEIVREELNNVLVAHQTAGVDDECIVMVVAILERIKSQIIDRIKGLFAKAF